MCVYVCVCARDGVFLRCVCVVSYVWVRVGEIGVIVWVFWGIHIITIISIIVISIVISVNNKLIVYTMFDACPIEMKIIRNPERKAEVVQPVT